MVFGGVLGFSTKFTSFQLSSTSIIPNSEASSTGIGIEEIVKKNFVSGDYYIARMSWLKEQEKLYSSKKIREVADGGCIANRDDCRLVLFTLL